MLVTTAITGVQVQERRVGLVGLGDQEIALAEARVRVGRQQPAADDERRIEPAFGEHRRDEARRRRLAVRAGDRDALLQAHQLGQHQRARHDRDAALARGDDLGIVGGDRRRHDDRVGAGDVRRGVADRDRRRRAARGAASSPRSPRDRSPTPGSPASASTSAMPLMPAPPMPTKWTRLTLCFIARAPQGDARVGDAIARRRCARPCARRRAIASSVSRVSDARRAASRSGVELRLRESSAPRRRRRGTARSRSARRRSRPGSGTMIAADADRGELGDRHRAAAAERRGRPRA